MQLNQIIDIIADQVVLDPNDLNADTVLSDHLDSLDLSEIASIIEHRSGVDISDADVAKCVTIGDLHRLVEGKDLVLQCGGSFDALKLENGARRHIVINTKPAVENTQQSFARIEERREQLQTQADSTRRNIARFAYGFVFGLIVILIVWFIHQ